MGSSRSAVGFHGALVGADEVVMGLPVMRLLVGRMVSAATPCPAPCRDEPDQVPRDGSRPSMALLCGGNLRTRLLDFDERGLGDGGWLDRFAAGLSPEFRWIHR